MPRLLLGLIVAATAACRSEPLLESPAAAARREDRALARELERQLLALPDVVSAGVLVDRGFVDPLAPAAPAPRPRASVALTVEHDDASATAHARRLVASAVAIPDAEVVVAVGRRAPGAQLAQVGPFQVSPQTRWPLALTLAALLLVMGGAAAMTAWRAYPRRRGNRPQ